MNEKIELALKTAEKNYRYSKHQMCSDKTFGSYEHIIALQTLFESLLHYGFPVSQAPCIFCELDKKGLLFKVLIRPHLKIVDDLEMIAAQYAKMYIEYIMKIKEGFESKKAIETLFV